MKMLIHSLLAALIIVGSSSTVAPAQDQDTVEEKSTGKLFPKTVSFAGDYKTFNLEVTGLSLRKKYWAKVYGMAHYMEAGAKFSNKRDAQTVALSDQYAKQFTLVFVRDVGADKIQDAFREGFKKNSSDSERSEITTMIETFIGFFTRDIKNGERIVLRSHPGGKVTAIIHGEEQDPISSVTFSRVLWRIWLGKHSIVDRDRLVRMVVED